MPRKKRNQADGAVEPPVTTDNTAVATAEPETSASPLPIRRPAWIDGAPVAADGQIIREGSPRPTPQMDLAGRAERSELQQEESPSEQHGKNWGPPYKSIFTCREMGFELGENRRYKQRVFRFSLKPTEEILAALKENGFTYRAGEKAWTVNANAQTRKLSDELARQWAGPDYIKSIER